MLIYETQNFILESHDTPEVDRLEGGHIKISPKRVVEDRLYLTPQEVIEMTWLTQISGGALRAMMKKIGVEIGRINYQDNGNWKPELHVHLYGRAKTATMQQYGDPIIPGHRDEYHPLTTEDIEIFRGEISRLISEFRFSLTEWGLTPEIILS